MAMNSSINSPLILYTIFIIILHLIFPSSCFLYSTKHSTDSSTRSFSFEEKNRLGSTPPSCHNKCNQCHPCMAVQVTTLPSHDRVQPGQSPRSSSTPLDYYEYPTPAGNRYSNYKPLGWKCRCKNHFYNP